MEVKVHQSQILILREANPPNGFELIAIDQVGFPSLLQEGDQLFSHARKLCLMLPALRI